MQQNPSDPSTHISLLQWRCGVVSACPRAGYEVFQKSDREIILQLKDELLSSLSSSELPSSHCYHLPGHGGVKLALADLSSILASGHYPYIIRSDAKGYYENIEHHKLISILKQNGLSRALYQATLQICQRVVCKGGVYTQNTRGIPAGCSASPALAALYLNPLDKLMQTMKGVRYLRYMDDWIILCKSRWTLRMAVRQMHQTLSSLGLQAHPDKTFIGKSSRTFDFLGAEFNPPKETTFQSSPSPISVTVPSKVSVQRLKEKLQHHFSSCTQLYELGKLKSLESVECYLTHWLAWSKGIGIALPNSLEAIAKALGIISKHSTCRMTQTFAHWTSQWVNTQILKIKIKIKNYENDKKNTSCNVVNGRGCSPVCICS
jgi:hypothetical protein